MARGKRQSARFPLNCTTTTMAENATSAGHVRCPKCYSLDVRYSKRGMWDSMLDLLFHMEVFRCRSCRKRFHLYIPDDGEDSATGRGA